MNANRRAGLRVLIVLALALVLIGCALLAKREVDELTYCSSAPTQQQQNLQQAFVLAHVPDARGFEWQTSDCDDQGESVLTYKTGLTSTQAIAMYRANPACTAATWANDPDLLICESSGTLVEVGMEPDGGPLTTGYLGWEDRGVER